MSQISNVRSEDLRIGQGERLLLSVAMKRAVLGSTHYRFALVCIVVLALGGGAFVSAQNSASDDQETARFQVSCGIRYLSDSRAELRWESNLAGPSTVAFGTTRQLGNFLESASLGQSHSVILEDLEPNADLYYRIAVKHAEGRKISDFFVVESGMNYSLPELKLNPSVQLSPPTQALRETVKSLETKLSGIVIVDETLAESHVAAFLDQGELSVLVVFNDEEDLQDFRERWYEMGAYGVNLSAQLASDLPADFANAVVAEPEGLERAMSWLSPSGRILCQSKDRPRNLQYRGEAISWSALSDEWWLGTQNSLDSLSKWGHQYGSTANTSYVGETLEGVDDASQLQVQWLGRPGADFGIDRNPRMPAPLVVGGRLFHQGMNRMVAVDAFNGSILWSLELPKLRRVNIPRDSGNWCADEKRVYAAVGDLLWVIDAATGEMLHTIEPPEAYQTGFDWGYIAATEEYLVGSVVPGGGQYQEFWDKPSWYDSINDVSASKVCGRNLMVFDKKYGDLKWQYELDSVLHSTITIHQGRLYFIEVEDESLREQSTGRLPDSKIWANASVVCLDLETGERQWKVPAPSSNAVEVIAFGVADDSQFVLETSSGGNFHLSSFDALTGEKRWAQSAKWSENHHGGHMQHAVLMEGKIFLQPNILDASTGEIIKTDTLGKRRGCATPIGAGGSIIYRGGTGPVTLWSLEDEKTSEFARLRPSCWLSTIPAHGMLYSPEAGGGCSCGGWMECSIGFAPIPVTTQTDQR